MGELISQEGISQEIIQGEHKNGQGERIINEIQRMLRESKSTLVKKKCIELIPQLYRSFISYYKHPGRLTEVIDEIKKYIAETKGKDRGQGFISLGRLSVRADVQIFEPHVQNIVDLVYKEIKSPIR